MNINDVRSLVTLAGLVLFLGLVAWTWWPARKSAHDAAAQLPFDAESDDVVNGAKRESERRAAPSRTRSPRGIGRGTPRTRGQR